MRRLTALLVPFLLCPAALGAQAPVSPELCRAVARAWSLPATELEALAVQSGADLPDLAVVAMVAKSTGKSPGETWAIRAAEPTWAGAFAKAGLDPSTVIEGVEGRLSEATWASLLGRGEPVALAALVRTLERLSGRAPEPLARELGKKPFERVFAELAGVTVGPPRPAPPEGGDGGDGATLPGPEPRPAAQFVLPFPGYEPPVTGSQPPPSTVPTGR